MSIKPDSPEVRKAFDPIDREMSRRVFEQQLAQADWLVQGGRLEEAKALLEQLGEKSPDDPRPAERGRQVARKMAERRIAAALPQLQKMAAQRRWFETGQRVRTLLQESPEHPQLLALLDALAADRAAFLAGLSQDHVVPCFEEPNQTYTLYLPADFNPETPAPVLYISAPNGGPHSAELNLILRAAGHLPWMLVHINNSRNGPWDDILRAQDEVLGDVRSRFCLHPSRQFATGFSGGSRASFILAFRYPRQVRGVLGMGAGLPGWNEFPDRDLAACILIGSEDSNRQHDIPRSVGVLQKAGLQPVVKIYPGGHQHPPADLVKEALDWLDRTVR